MIYENNLRPFQSFWMNCYLNNMCSILSSYDPSYKLAAYINNYHYIMPYISDGYRCLDIDYPDEFCNNFSQNILTENTYCFNDEKTMIKGIKELLKEKKNIYLLVDLYYLIPNKMTWHKYHYNHYTLIKGYDDYNDIYYILEDDSNGYGIRKVSEKVLVESYMNSEYFTKQNSQTQSCYSMKLKENIKPFQFSLKEIILYSQNLSCELVNCNLNELWKNTKQLPIKDSNLDDSIVGIQHIVNRHKANQYLFKSLLDFKIFDERCFSKLRFMASEIEKGWIIMKNILLKTSMKNKKDLNLLKLYDSGSSLILKEYEMWKNLLIMLS